MKPAEQAIRSQRIIPTLRGDYTAGDLELITGLLQEHGLTVLEYTLTGQGALAAIERLKEDHGDSLFVGAGTVRTAADVTAALAAGADFLVSPQFTADLGTAAAERDSALIPGVFTPREAELAHRAGFSLQKLFPAGSGGPAHLRALLGPYPHLSFIPTGGVNPDNAAAYFRAGAVAVGIGTGLFAPGADAETLRTGLSTVLQAARAGGTQ